MIAWIGNDVLVRGKWYHVQDNDLLNMITKIGNCDDFGIVWDTFWEKFEEISKQKLCDNSCKRLEQEKELKNMKKIAESKKQLKSGELEDALEQVKKLLDE